MTQAERLHHLYVIGQTGTGKSTLLENLMRQDLEAGRGFAFLDPHADTIGTIAASAREHRHSDVISLDVPSPSCEFGFNPLDTVPPDQRPLAASGIIESFKNVWGQWWGPRLEHLFRNALLTLLDQPTATLADLTLLFGDDNYRKEAVARVMHPGVRDFWAREFAHYPIRYRAEALAPLLNKLGAFLSQPPLYRILTKERSSFDLREVMDSGKVLLVNLAKGRMGADACSLLGALLVSRIGLAGLSRADIPESSRRPFFVYLDEFQNFTTLSVATMLSELRKYKVGLILAHQYVAQVETEVRDAILGNVGNMVVFRVGPPDARYLHQYFSPEFEDLDLMNLPNYNIYLRVMMQGQLSRPFSAETLPP
ncbi:MAG TPA: type IV secretion system DNA-binding domain-containing protein [Planctomycetota bacterium]|jgi:type IV secretory pathway TraG/TraD family ATPase VirD4|nr:type IV secretion system DNA-binding domain-containing protein [Planctomycetota bacterium]